MKLEVGMYVRYKTLSNRIKIAKIIEIDKKVLDLDNKDCTTEKYIIGEPSHNPIDLIEPGDYVNGSLVININYDINLDEDVVENISIFNYSIEGVDVLQEKDIKSIVTKEQFEAMEYRLGDK